MRQGGFEAHFSVCPGTHVLGLPGTTPPLRSDISTNRSKPWRSFPRSATPHLHVFRYIREGERSQLLHADQRHVQGRSVRFVCLLAFLARPNWLDQIEVDLWSSDRRPAPFDLAAAEHQAAHLSVGNGGRKTWNGDLEDCALLELQRDRRGDGRGRQTSSKVEVQWRKRSRDFGVMRTRGLR